MAYEQFAGPIGHDQMRNQVQDLHYLTQWTNYLLGAWVTKEGEKNPVPEPQRVGWDPPEDEDEDEEE